MKKNLFIPAVIIVLLIGCRPEENREQLTAVNKSVEYANGIMQDANRLIYEGFMQLEKDPQTINVGAVLNSRVKQIRQYADSIKALIRDIKVELIKQSDSLKKDYVDVTKQLHSVNGVGYRLLNKLTTFKDSIPAIIYFNRAYTDKNITPLLQTIPLLSGYGESLTADQRSDYERKWLEESFGHSSSLMSMIMLNKLESDVLATERTLIDHCNTQVAIDPVIYDKFSVVASLSSSYVKAGQSVELTAGVGAFSGNINPRITIDGKEVKLNDDAVAVYKFVASGKPGKHTIPVRIEFIKPDGSKAMALATREYIIADN